MSCGTRMMNRRHAPPDIRHSESSLPLLPIYAGEEDADAAALAVVVRDEVVADEAQGDVADVAAELQGIARGRAAHLPAAASRALYLGPVLSWERCSDEVGENFGADDEPLERLPALPEPPGRRRDKDHLVAGARRTVQHELGADSERPRIFRRVRHARRRLLRGRVAPTPDADTRTRPRAPRRNSRRGKFGDGARKLQRLPRVELRGGRALRQRPGEDRQEDRARARHGLRREEARADRPRARD